MPDESTVIVRVLEAQVRSATAIADLYGTMREIAELLERTQNAEPSSSVRLELTRADLREQIAELERRIAELS
ncbi:MAG TPA: hypothetical protein VFV99_17275 [Kofleriaceae bacterium]|nr:hypothetical protein [Kofleriaceae bacterium]